MSACLLMCAGCCVLPRPALLQVYNEQIYDLLDEQGIGPLGQRGLLKLKEDAVGRVFVAGLSEVWPAPAPALHLRCTCPQLLLPWLQLLLLASTA